MKTPIRLLVAACAVAFAAGQVAPTVPATVTTLDGKTIEGITKITDDGDKIRIDGAGGIARVAKDKLTPESRKSLGLPAYGVAELAAMNLKELTTLDGKVFKQIESVKVRPSHISFRHSTGAASVDFKNLPEAMRKQFGYDPELAEAYERERIAAEKNYIAYLEDHARKVEDEKIKQSKRQMFSNLYHYTTIGTDRYWILDSRQRALYDSIAVKSMIDAGYTHSEAIVLLDRLRFR